MDTYIKDILLTIDTIVRTMDDTAVSLAGTLVPTGLDLLNILSAIALTWFGLKMMFGEFVERSIQSMIQLIMVWGIAAWFLTAYSWLAGQINGGFDEVAQLIGQAAGISGGDPDTAVIDGVRYLGQAIVKIWDSTVSVQWGDSWITVLGNLGENLKALFLGAVIVSTLAAAAFIYVGVYLLGKVLMGVAFIVGPILVPWLVVEPMAFLFQGWVRFLIVAGLYRVVAAAMIAFTGSLLMPLFDAETILVKVEGKVVVSIGATFGLVLVAGMVVLVMLRIPEIAQSLVTGLPRISGVGGIFRGRG